MSPGTRRMSPEPFPPQVLGSYAFIADGERGCLIGPRGDVAWMCAPSWDSDAVFASLIGGPGVYAVTPAASFTWGGYYEPASLIWRSRWVTHSGVIECREGLAFPGDPDRVVLLRRVTSPETRQDVDLVLAPRPRFGRDHLRDVHRHGRTWTATNGNVWMRWQGPEGAHLRTEGADPEWRGRVQVVPAEPVDLVLELATRPFDDQPVEADTAWDATAEAWAREPPNLEGTLDPKGASQAHAVMRGLTSAGGGMVAAATTSLPERAEQGRNYDYRYVWIRDQSYAGQAAAAAGSLPLLDGAVRFITARLLEHGPHLAPAYRIDGTAIPDQRSLDLPGYPGGYDLVGNHVNAQFQLDAFGESLLLLAAAAGHDRIGPDSIRAAHVAAAAIDARWQEPDAGIWEIDNRLWTHSRLICVAGLRQAARTLGGHGSPDAAQWSALADRIVAATANSSTHPSGYWQRSPDDPTIDAALLFPALRGAVPADDPRSSATLQAVLDDLTQDGYAYRFRHGNLPLAHAEGSFTLCGFTTALALHQQGEVVEAVRWFERTARCTGSTGIHAEEWDVDEHQMRGNLPQAFVHALHLEAAVRLAGRRDV